MKEVNAAREEYWASKLKIEEQLAYLEDRFIYGTGGERNTEKKTVSLQRDKLYEEMQDFPPPLVFALLETKSLRIEWYGGFSKGRYIIVFQM